MLESGTLFCYNRIQYKRLETARSEEGGPGDKSPGQGFGGEIPNVPPSEVKHDKREHFCRP